MMFMSLSRHRRVLALLFFFLAGLGLALFLGNG